MAGIRHCDQCGAVFEPPREHARFCSAGCRIAWNRQNADDITPGSALAWSLLALRDTTQRLAELTVTEPCQGFTIIGESVWRVTIVDATLVRYYPGAYEQILGSQEPLQRQVTETTLAGLRFVRNQMGYTDPPSAFIQPAGAISCSTRSRVAEWTWKEIISPPPASPAGPASWEMDRYQAYQAQLAGHAIGGTFQLTTAFLLQAAAQADSGDESH
jgi:hypothetical protein